MLSSWERGRPARCRKAIALLRESSPGLEQIALVAVSDDWLSLSRPLGAIDRDDAWRLLRDHTAQGGALALTLAAGDDALTLRVDVALHGDDDGDDARRIRDAGAAITGGAPSLPGPRADAPDAERAPAGAGLEYLIDLLREAGWPPLERPGGRLKVDLEVPGGYFQADARPSERGGAFVVTLVRWEEAPSEPVRAALACLLLRAAGAVRLVRPFARESAGGAAAGFEIAWNGAPSGAEIADSLRALSVACALCGREADALLRDDDLTRRYLETQLGATSQTINRPAARAAG